MDVSESVIWRLSNCERLVWPAVNHSGGVFGVLVHVFSNQMSETDEELRGFRHSVIRPGREVELTHRTCLCCFYLKDEHNGHIKAVRDVRRRNFGNSTLVLFWAKTAVFWHLYSVATVIRIAAIRVLYFDVVLPCRKFFLATQITTHIFYVKVPKGPVLQWYFRGHCDVDIVKVLGANIPVLLTFNLEKLFRNNWMKNIAEKNTTEMMENMKYVYICHLVRIIYLWLYTTKK